MFTLVTFITVLVHGFGGMLAVHREVSDPWRFQMYTFYKDSNWAWNSSIVERLPLSVGSFNIHDDALFSHSNTPTMIMKTSVCILGTTWGTTLKEQDCLVKELWVGMRAWVINEPVLEGVWCISEWYTSMYNRLILYAIDIRVLSDQLIWPCCISDLITCIRLIWFCTS